jgi:hypothetical protein
LLKENFFQPVYCKAMLKGSEWLANPESLAAR